jgi:hypothetical protein
MTKGRAKKAGITNLNRVYTRDDMVTKDVIFAATGVTDGSILPGIKREPELPRGRDDPDALQDRVGAAHDLPQPALGVNPVARRGVTRRP